MADRKFTSQISQEQFQQLQEYTLYSRKALKEALDEFVESTGSSGTSKKRASVLQEEGLSYEEFRSLLTHFLNADVGEQLTKSLFDSFREAPQRHRQSVGPDGNDQTKAADGKKSTPEASPTSPRLKSSRVDNDGDPTPLSLLDPHDAVAAVGSIISERRASLSDIMCYLSLLEAGKPEEKLEFMFKMYDVDNSNYLENEELDCIMTRMVTVAEYLGWDTSELKPILKEMLDEIDADSDGKISLKEWIQGGLHTIPLLVLLGLETRMKDGLHQWRLKHFNHPAFCNICRHLLIGLGKQGLVCSFCHYTVHERCVARVGETCLSTYTKSCRNTETMQHHWVEGNSPGKCDRCGKNVKAMNALTGLKCSWCHRLVHNTCVAEVPTECDLGPHRCHVLPPISIVPAVLQSHPSSHAPQSASIAADTAFSFESLDTKVMPLAGTSPLAVFINPKSGGKQGLRLISKFQYLLNPRQVFNLSKGGPKPGMQFFSKVPNCRVLCCGGDGTVGWVLSVIDELGLEEKPPIGVLPLGTGNDLARCLAWGGGYEGEDLGRILHQLRDATVIKMDRWKVDVKTESTGGSEEEKGDPVPLDIINNYFSVGVDASIAHKFHVMRENYPEKFKSRMRNKVWYFEFGAGEMVSASCRDLHDHISLEVDGKEVKLANCQLEGIAILNIPSMYGGSNVWGADDKPRRTWSLSRSSSLENTLSSSADEFLTQDISDMQLEVVGLESSLHVGQIKAGIRGHGQRLAQGSNIVIRTKRRFPMQIDGEPWMQPPCTITINHHNQVPMLHAPKLKKQRTSGFLFFNREKTAQPIGTSV